MKWALKRCAGRSQRWKRGRTPPRLRPPPPRDEIGVPQSVPDPKEKAIKQARAIIVAAPKEEAEMVDIRANPRKRGRPRKNPVVDPPDPHKGSVLYPEKGVCADPVDKGAILGEGGGSPTAVTKSVS